MWACLRSNRTHSITTRMESVLRCKMRMSLSFPCGQGTFISVTTTWEIWTPKWTVVFVSLGCQDIEGEPGLEIPNKVLGFFFSLFSVRRKPRKSWISQKQNKLIIVWGFHCLKLIQRMFVMLFLALYRNIASPFNFSQVFRQ